MKDIEALKSELRRVQQECVRLRAENARLRREQARLWAAPDPPVTSDRVSEPPDLPDRLPEGSVTDSSSGAAKIALFRGLFRGREDAYAVRWERPDGRHGYAPASRSRSDRERGVFLPLTDQVIRDHLIGTQTIGVYPLRRDETCWLLAADFDKERWPEDVAAYLAACDALGISAALERSRSGKGAHVWLFFEEPVAAERARKLGCILLTRAMEHRHQIGLDSYDRLFPNQDTMPKGGFGNLIALPLQGQPRRQGNSIFVDRSFEAYADQWAFLSSICRVRLADVEAIVAAAMRTGGVLGVRASLTGAEGEEDPWTVPPSGKRLEKRVPGPFPPSVPVTIANLVYVAKEGLPPAMLSRLWRLAAFQNPEFYRAQAMRLSTFGKPRVISCAEEFERHIGLPRGCLDEVRELLATHSIGVDVVDERYRGGAIDVAFHGELAPQQRQAAEAALGHDIGVICAPTAFGKTVVAAWLIAARRVNTLVLVHRRHLADQWRERLATFLDLPPTAIGQIGGGRSKPGGQIDVALIQSLGRPGSVDDIVAQYGQVVVDECHHVPAFSFERVLKAAKARYVLGLTATPIRKDGHHPILVMQCGPLRFWVTTRDEAAARPFEQIVITRTTGFRLPDGADEPGIQGIYTALSKDEPRNDLICADLLDTLRQRRTPLLLTERTEHLDELARRLGGQVSHLVVLRGGMGTRKRRAAVEQLRAIPEGEAWALLATGRYAGEGFDPA